MPKGHWLQSNQKVTENLSTEMKRDGKYLRCEKSHSGKCIRNLAIIVCIHIRWGLQYYCIARFDHVMTITWKREAHRSYAENERKKNHLNVCARIQLISSMCNVHRKSPIFVLLVEILWSFFFCMMSIVLFLILTASSEVIVIISCTGCRWFCRSLFFLFFFVFGAHVQCNCQFWK